jgi:hypothetical protein
VVSIVEFVLIIWTKSVMAATARAELVAVQSVMKTVIFTSVAMKRKVSILAVIALSCLVQS